MKLLLSLALTLVAVNPAQADCSATFCPNGITIPDGEIEVDETTIIPCSDAGAAWSELAAFGDEEECLGAYMQGSASCCPTKQAGAICFLCGSASATFNADKMVPDAASCRAVDAALSYIPIASFCTEVKASFDTEFNLASYCECSDVPAPELCKVCDDNQEVNASANLPGDDGMMTCGEGFDYAKHITNQTLCDVEVETAEIKSACCKAKLTSGGIRLSVKGLAAALLVGAAFAICFPNRSSGGIFSCHNPVMKFLFSLAVTLVAIDPSKAQCDYNFCGGVVTNPTTIITSPGGVQAPCSLVQTGIDFGQVNAEQCLGLPEIEKICCPAGGSTGGDSGATTQTCFVCDGGVTFNKDKTWRGAKLCAEYDSSISALPAGQVCDAAKGAANLNLNMPSLCECEGAIARDLCKICGDNQNVNMDTVVPDSNGQLTCSESVDYVKHIKNEADCSVFITDSVKAACCVDKSDTHSLSLSSIAAAFLFGLAFAI